LKQTDQPPISQTLLQTGRAIRFLRRPHCAPRWHFNERGKRFAPKSIVVMLTT
jgi:hypothetical protein